MATPLPWDEVKRVVVRLLEAAADEGLPISAPIVLVGGSALAAHGVREDSVDVDLYLSNPPEDLVFRVEKEFEAIYGDGFRLDVTGTENLWGTLLIRDLAQSPVIGEIVVRSARYELRALALEDLFLVKLNAGRRKDRDDLRLIAGRTTPDALIERFNHVLPWHGGPGGAMALADAFVTVLGQEFGLEPLGVIARLAVSRHVRTALEEAYGPEQP